MNSEVRRASPVICVREPDAHVAAGGILCTRAMARRDEESGGCAKPSGVSHAAVEKQHDYKKTKFGHATSGIVRFFKKP